jgi:hypothetical protein
MCDYQGYEFGAGRYPDSVCIDGRLFDADNCDGDGNLYEPMDYLPCPMCCPLEAVKYWFDYNGGADEPNSLKCALSLVNDIRKNRGITARIKPSEVKHFLARVTGEQS